MVLTTEERERRAYIEGRVEEARLLARILDLKHELASREPEEGDEGEEEAHLRDTLAEIARLCRQAL